MFIGPGSQDKASWAGPWKLQLLQLAKNCWEMLYRNTHEIWNLFTANILWLMPVWVQGSGIGDILKSRHWGMHTIRTDSVCLSMARMSPGTRSVYGRAVWPPRQCIPPLHLSVSLLLNKDDSFHQREAWKCVGLGWTSLRYSWRLTSYHLMALCTVADDVRVTNCF